MKSVLLLNASYEPLGIISWKKAVCLFFSGKAEIIDEYSENIRSISIVIKAPAVIRLFKYVSFRKAKPALSRANILARDNFECQYCGEKLSSKSATLDHILPKSLGGLNSWKNIVCCCKRCNLRKGARLPKEANMPLLKKPTVPDWLPVLKIKLNEKIPISWKNFIRARYK